jgi:murein DD-endopeptidase MepM/ murein hydrolase activator NlpD
MAVEVARRRAGDGPARLRAAAVALWLATTLGGCSAMHWFSSPSEPTRPPENEASLPRGTFSWPADGQISSAFGRRGKTNHDGIDIAAPEGTPVHAAADGSVIFTGNLRGYGKVVILEHRPGLTTVYAHLQETRVEVGARVKRGDMIASLGQTGKTTGPNLHFEVRRHNVAKDPIAFLPAKSPSLFAQQPPRRADRRVGG